MKKKISRIAVSLLLACFILIQFVPVNRSNPPVQDEPVWDKPETRVLAGRACFDCHSNETRWPWYSHVAPASWIVARHVKDGREHLNFSEWPGGELDEAAEEIEKEKMPLPSYALLHPEALLTAQERAALIAGLKAMARAENEDKEISTEK